MTFSDQPERVRNRDGASNARSHYRAGKTPKVCTSSGGHDRITSIESRGWRGIEMESGSPRPGEQGPYVAKPTRAL